MCPHTLRVAIDSQIFCSQSYGGVSRYFCRLATELSLQQQNVHIFAPLHRNAYLQALPASMRTGGRLPYVVPGAKKVLRSLNRLISRRSMRRWKPDIIHESYYHRAGPGIGPVPSIVTVYDMVHELFPEAFSRLDDTSDQKRAAVDRADHVICISYNTQRDLLQLFGTDERKVSVVHLGHDPLSSNAEVPKELADGKPYILYVANRSLYKNFTCLLRAYSIASDIRRDYRLVVFGGGALTAKERATMAGLGVHCDDVVQISGTDEILAGTYKGASAFVYPSLYEGFGLSPLEAMGLGCPVISSNASCMPEVLGNAAEYFNPGSAAELASALERVLGDETRSAALRALGYVQAEKFTWAETARKTSDIYRSVIASR